MTSAKAAERGGPGTSSDRLQRLLALVPYVISRKVVGLAETAAAFGVSEPADLRDAVITRLKGVLA